MMTDDDDDDDDDECIKYFIIQIIRQYCTTPLPIHVCETASTPVAISCP